MIDLIDKTLPDTLKRMQLADQDASRILVAEPCAKFRRITSVQPMFN